MVTGYTGFFISNAVMDTFAYPVYQNANDFGALYCSMLGSNTDLLAVRRQCYPLAM